MIILLYNIVWTSYSYNRLLDVSISKYHNLLINTNTYKFLKILDLSTILKHYFVWGYELNITHLV